MASSDHSEAAFEAEPPPEYEILSRPGLGGVMYWPKARIKAGYWDEREGAVKACWAHRKSVLRAHVPCQSCGWEHARSPTENEELPIVRGALDATFTAIPL